MKLRNYHRTAGVSVLLATAILSGYCAKPCLAETDEKELFLVAQKAFEDGFYDVAIRYIEQFLDKYPQTDKRVEANLLLGQCYFFKSQYLKAFDIFQGLLQYTEFKDATLFWLGETYLKGSDYTQAEKQYRQVIDIYPNSIYTPQAYYSLGWVFYEKKDFKTAKGVFLDLSKKFPIHQLTEDAFFKLGECDYNLHSYETAVQYFKDYVLKFPKSNRHDQAYFYIAETYYYQNDFPSAITYYTKASEISHDQNLVLLCKVSTGWCYLKPHQFEPAQKAFDDALAFAQSKNIISDDVYFAQANLYSEMGQNDKSLEYYEKLITSFPNSPRLAEGYLGKANMLYILKKYPEAIEVYQEMIKKFAATADLKETVQKAYFGLAWTQLKNKDIDSAITNFTKILNQTDSKIIKASALTQIGDAYQDAGNLDKALETYDRILQDFPDSLYSDYVQYRQWIVLLKMEKIEAATLSFQTLKTNFPQSKYLTDAQYYLGVAYFKKNAWAAAKEQVENFITNAPKDSQLLPEANYILALSTFNLNDAAKAMKIFEKIIRDYPDQDALIKNSELGTAKCFYALGNAKEAVQKFKILVYKYPGTEVEQDSLFWLGDYYLENANFADASEYYQLLIEKFPGSERINLARYELAQSYFAQNEFDKALNLYKLIDDPKDKELYAKAKLAIADIFSKEMDLDQALATYQSIAASCPDFKRDAFLKIAEAYREKKIYDQAIEAYKSAIGSDIGLSDLKNAELQFNIADTYELLSKKDEAIDEYLKIAYLYASEKEWVTKAYLRIARIFEDKEDWENAKLTYQKIVELGTEEVKFAKERLDWIAANINPAQ